MQKALDQMNLQLHHVISDITGTTGLAILDAILDGNRDVHALATLRDPRIRASHETIAKSLVGDYRREHLFTLRQSVALYREYQRQITTCEQEMHLLMKDLETKADPTATLPAAKDSVKKCKVMRRSLPYFRRGPDCNSRHQCPACAVHSCRVGARHLKSQQFWSFQFLDGAMSGQRYQRREGALDWNEKSQEPHCRHPSYGRPVTATE